MISALLQYYWKMIDTPRVYGGLFSIIIQLTPTKFGGHIERWSPNNTIGSVFSIFLPAAIRLSRKMQVASLVYLKTTYPPYLRKYFS